MQKVYMVSIILLLLGSCKSNESDNPFLKIMDKETAANEFQIFKNILKSSHPSLNLYVKEKRFAQIMDSLEKTISDNISFGEMFSKYNYITNEIGCAHTYVSVSDEVYDSLLRRPYFFPLPVKLVEDKLLVNVFDWSLPEGTEIKAINGESVPKIIEKIRVCEAVEGYHRQTQGKIAVESFALNYFYLYGRQNKFEVRIRDTIGFEKDVSLLPVSLSEWNDTYSDNIYYYDRVQCDYDFKIDEVNAFAVMRIRTFRSEGSERQEAYKNFCKNSFELLYRKKNISSLIIDLRENLGGDLTNSSLLFSYLAKEDFKEYEAAISKIKEIPETNYLEKNFEIGKKELINETLSEEFSPVLSKTFYKLVDTFIDRWKPDKYSFKGNVYIITNSKVASAASYFSVMVKNAGVGKIVGEETSGGTYSGNGFANLQYSLPYSKIKLVFPYAHLIYSYKDKENRGHGLLPDYEIADSYQSFKNNEDRQMFYIIDSLIPQSFKYKK
ncbi:MAG: hypothetical protein H7X88_12530 [Gloeobacteraceae cyanobacterium ES-bin-316]|nr:hypothetical protein [Ferruginibacter sp.]